ncbi:unnamed protein product [Lota lota]
MMTGLKKTKKKKTEGEETTRAQKPTRAGPMNMETTKGQEIKSSSPWPPCSCYHNRGSTKSYSTLRGAPLTYGGY